MKIPIRSTVGKDYRLVEYRSKNSAGSYFQVYNEKTGALVATIYDAEYASKLKELL